MASINISNSLKEYLSKSGASDSNTSSDNSAKGGYFSWFNKSTNSQSKGDVIDETSNGWFSEAQKDPILPSLVSKCSCEESVINAIMAVSVMYSMCTLYKTALFTVLM